MRLRDIHSGDHTALMEARREQPMDKANLERQLLLPFRARSNRRQAIKDREAGYSSQIDTGMLQRAVNYHRNVMRGKRWPALEYAFLQRANTFKGSGGDCIRPRTSLFTYLSNIKKRWPEGEALANELVMAWRRRGDSNRNLRNLEDSPGFRKYVTVDPVYDSEAIGWRPEDRVPEDYYAL